MKRLAEWNLEHFSRRSAYQQRRRTTRNPRARAKVRRATIKFHGNLDLIDNPEVTRRQLLALDTVRRKHREGKLRLFVDLSHVTFIDACALAHLAAQLDRMGRNRRRFSISGNYPLAPEALSMLRDAKFEHFMGAANRLKAGPPTVANLELRTGSGLRPREWAPLARFIKAHGGLTEDEAEPFYAAFGECVENVVQHAHTGVFGRWYAVALRPTTGPARAVIVDLGIGIPKSIRLDVSDRVRSAFAKSIDLMANFLRLLKDGEEEESSDDEAMLGAIVDSLTAFDWSCVYLATLGKRTETGEEKRGKGLSQLRREVIAHDTRALHVLSGRGGVTWRGSVPPAPANLTPLRGTVVCLEIGSPRSAGGRGNDE